MVLFARAGFFAARPSARLGYQPDRISRTASKASGEPGAYGGSMTAAVEEVAGLPDMKVSIRQLFGIDSDLEVPAYSKPEEHVPDLDPDYRFDRSTTLAILAGFAH